MILNFPPPANWQDFQILTARLVEQHCLEGTVHEYGRQGQRQHGVDVYGQLPGQAAHMGVQCKQMQPHKTLTKAIIKAEADLALKFQPRLTTFIVATTLEEDTKAHDAVTDLNGTKNYHFTISYWSWNHYNDRLNRSNQLVADSYKAYALSFGYDQELEDLEALKRGFDRPAFVDDFRHEVNYDDFVLALGDTELFLQTGLLRDRLSHSLISTTYAHSMLPSGDNKRLRATLLKEVKALRELAIQHRKEKKLNSNLAGEYNARRLFLLTTVNAGLAKGKIAPVSPGYTI